MTPLGGQLLFLLSSIGLSYACSCGSLSWATCDEPSCECYIIVGEGQRHVLNCTMLIPKCFLMKAEMYRLRHPSSLQNKPIETTLADSDGLYDPDCESSGLFKAKQCNNTDVCWCVDSAGVRRSEKDDRNLKCEEQADANWVHVQIKHKESNKPMEYSQLQSAIAGAIQEWYKKDQELVKVKFDVDASLITLDMKNDIDDQTQDLSDLSYYMQKDVEVDIQPLLHDQMKLEPTLSGQKLEMESILVYHEEEKTPAVSMQRLTVGILTVTVVVTLAILVGLLILFLIRRPNRGKYEKAQTSETEEI